MESYPDHKTYRRLYRRFYEGRPAEKLIKIAGLVAGKNVLDLCGGDGRLSLVVVKLGAKSVCLIDRERAMVSNKARLHSKIKVFINTVESQLEEFMERGRYFDCIFCQQAVNYWLNDNTAKLVADVLAEGGVFVFNTFNRKPPEKPMIKKYEIDGKKFLEVSWLVGDLVHHVQKREGLPCHITSFRWLSPDYLADILDTYFSVTVKKDGNTSLYRCIRK
ncbi:MAG: class I SAM-dependent methyltransferase [Candidatus Harrisonbacteria bacterium]|nr:class I SAM-dependent methyltransferase [Candidatus Harrisonbacteria bacterium]